MRPGCAGIVALVAFTAVAVAHADDVPAACRSQIDARVPGWRLSHPPPELARLAAQRNETTNIASADFDLDGTVDTALLVTAPSRGRRIVHLVVCLDRAVAPRTFVIREPYGQDGIGVRPKGTVDYDHRSGRKITYWTNGVSTYAFEKAGGTYLFKDGRFVLIVDSD